MLMIFLKKLVKNATVSSITTNDKFDIEKYTIEQARNFVKNTIDEITKDRIDDRGVNADELKKRENKKTNLMNSLKDCVSGDYQAKYYVKDFMADLLLKLYGVNEKTVNYFMSFDHPQSLTVQDKFDILLHIYKKSYGMEALAKLIETHELDRPKSIDDMYYYCITEQDIHDTYKKEKPYLKFEDKLDIVVQRIYSLYKGFNCVDDIRDMHIDGLSGGVNGLPEDHIIDHGKQFEIYLRQMKVERTPRSYDSVWLFFRGKSIHLRFLSFGSYAELQRICENIYKFGHPGQFSQQDGFKINKMKDGSRVVVVRPDFAETWAFFVRKFDIPDVTLDALVNGKNSDMVIELITYLVRGSRNISVTGEQGVGKTTFLMGLVEKIYAIYNLRLLEMAFELHLRKRFPNRNILTVQEKSHIPGQDGLDMLKKTDGAVTITGEVATDPVAAYMIQTAQVASKFTLFTHHAKTFSDLVMSLRNSLLKTGVFQKEQIAEEQVITVLHFDIHLKKDFYGKRFIERITECIPLEEEDYPVDFRSAQTLDDKLSAFMETALVYFKKTGGRKLYEARNIVEYDHSNDSYEVKHSISGRNIKEMILELTEEDQRGFKSFLSKYFGKEV